MRTLIRKLAGAPVELVACLLGIAAVTLWIASLTWGLGDVDATLDTGLPRWRLALCLAAALLAVGVSVTFWSRRSWVAACMVAAAGGGAIAGILTVTRNQLDPDVGGLYALSSAGASTVCGMVLILSAAAGRERRGRQHAIAAAGAATLVTGVVLALVVAPSWWRTRDVDSMTSPRPNAVPAGSTPARAIRWRHPFGAGESVAGIYGNRLLLSVAESSGRCQTGVRALDLITGDEAWQYLVPDRCAPIGTAGSVVGNDAVVQVRLGEGCGICGSVRVLLDPRTGQTLSPRKLPDVVRVVVGQTGIAYRSTYDPTAKQRLSGYNLQTGQRSWQRSPAPKCVAGGSLRPETILDPVGLRADHVGSLSNYVTGLPNGRVAIGYQCVSGTTAQSIWMIDPHGHDRSVALGPVPRDIQEPPQLLWTGRVLVASSASGLYGLTVTGELLWTDHALRPVDASQLGQARSFRPTTGEATTELLVNGNTEVNPDTGTTIRTLAGADVSNDNPILGHTAYRIDTVDNAFNVQTLDLATTRPSWKTSIRLTGWTSTFASIIAADATVIASNNSQIVVIR